MHNEYLQLFDCVSLHKAVEDREKKLCHVGNYVVYEQDELVGHNCN